LLLVLAFTVGNIPWRASVDELRDLFAQFGNVEVRDGCLLIFASA
jgi:RNA recognition motif-containing protein